MPRLPSPSSPGYLRIVRISARYDLIVAAGFATPWTYELIHRALTALTETFGLGTHPALTPMEMLYANLMGSLIVVWSVLRIRRPSAVHGLYDGASRLLFATGQTYALAAGVPAYLWAFLAVELAFGIAQLAPWLRAVRLRQRASA
ncbi:hypothetical protein [Streptomyces mesophilus]|uniref:hypothetical protein n=1 Tax=Streptomyces mesophilus TaxID=1775132 RepID=UPI0033194021